MVMERMYGVPISQIERLREAGHRHQEAGARRRDAFSSPRCSATASSTPTCTRATSWSAWTRPPSGRYIALDFGIVGTLTEFDKEYLAQNFLAFFRRDYKRVAAACTSKAAGCRASTARGRAGSGHPRRVRAVL